MTAIKTAKKYDVESLDLETIQMLGNALAKRLEQDFLKVPSLRCTLPEGHRFQLNYGNSIKANGFS